MTSDPIRELVQGKCPRVLVFLPNTNELQRFVWSGAFDRISDIYRLHFVLPSTDAEKMRAAAPEVITASNSSTIEIADERMRAWSRLFQAACLRYAHLSPSFAIRASLHIVPRTLHLLNSFPAPFWRRVEGVLTIASRWRWLPPGVKAKIDAFHNVLSSSNVLQDHVGFRFGRNYDRMVEKTLSELKPLPAILDLLERLNPLLVVIPTSFLDTFCNDVLWACEVEGIASLALQSGWDNVSSKGVIHHKPTYLGCWGEQSRLHAKEIQNVPKLSTISLGAPHYEFLKPGSAERSAEVRLSLGVRPGEKLILFGGSFRQFDETAAVRQLDDMIEKGVLGQVRVVYRPHPWRAERKHEDDFFKTDWKHVVFDPDMEERYRRARAEPGYIKREVPMFDMAYLADLLSAVDAVISPMSTLLIEALLMKRPTLAIAFGDGKHAHNPSVTSRMTHFADLRDRPGLQWCFDQADYADALKKLLGSGATKRHDQVRERLLDWVVTTRSGTYADRLAHFCTTTVNPNARKLRARRTGRRRGTISHAYGAHLIARDYAGIAEANPVVPGYWMHGWIPAYHNRHPAIVALHKKDGQHDGYDYLAQIREEKEITQQWVARSDQAEYLVREGYKHVKAIGLPFAYLPDIDVKRIPGSLLVMPPHSHRNRGPEDPLAEAYADAIAALKPQFEHIWVSLHEDDLAKNQWLTSFERRGINVMSSVDQSNPNTLLELKNMLMHFECVTTNGFGSHIAYAAFCGARVSVFGPFADFPYERMARTHAVKMFPELLDLAHWLCSEDAMRQNYPFLFCEPHKAVELADWGAAEIGYQHRMSSEALVEAFGWPKAARPAKAGTALLRAV